MDGDDLRMDRWKGHKNNGKGRIMVRDGKDRKGVMEEGNKKKGK